MGDEKFTGLHHKYDVKRVDDPTGKHAECRYFVLDPQHDPLAREALRRYASVARERGYRQLAMDLLAWVDRCEPKPPSSIPGEGPYVA